MEGFLLARASTITFPRYSLERCEEWLGDIPPAKPLAREDLLSKMGYTNPSSGPAGSAMGALNMFGLIDKNDDQYEITDLGRSLRNPLTEDQLRILRVVCLLNPERFREIYNEIKGVSIEHSGYIESLVAQRHALPDRAARRFEAVFLESFDCAGLLEEIDEHRIRIRNVDSLLEELRLDYQELAAGFPSLVNKTTDPQTVNRLMSLINGAAPDEVAEEPDIEQEEEAPETSSITVQDTFAEALSEAHDLAQFQLGEDIYVISKSDLVDCIRKKGKKLSDTKFTL
jgi:hypothetical protein